MVDDDVGGVAFGAFTAAVVARLVWLVGGRCGARSDERRAAEQQQLKFVMCGVCGECASVLGRIFGGLSGRAAAAVSVVFANGRCVDALRHTTFWSHSIRSRRLQARFF